MRRYTFALLISFSALLITCTGVFAAGGDMGGPTQDGSADHPYLIEDFNDFQAFCDEPNYWAAGVYTRLDCDIDLDPNLEGREIYDMAPIASNTYYSGHFDGEEHKISNLVIDGLGYCGLFGRLDSNSEIKNLEMYNFSVNSIGTFAACLAGYNYGEIINCYSIGDVNGNVQVGGLVGYNNGGSISDCNTNCYVVGSNYVGGLVGTNRGSITNCYTIGDVNSLRDSAGGLVGQNTGSGNINNCYTTGNIIASTDYAGGLVGNNSNSLSMTNCYATGNVTASDDYAGGLVGNNSGGANIIHCFATGDVAALNYTAGLVGYNTDGDITCCYATGKVNGRYTYTGGLVGYNNGGEVADCYANGTVSSINQYIGGLIGYNKNGDVTRCYSSGKVNSKSPFIGGGLIGHNSGGDIFSSFWDMYASGIVDPEAGSLDSDGMIGLSTNLMQMQSTFIDAGWDFIDETVNGTEDIWQMPVGCYPCFAWETINMDLGSPSNPYLITDFNDFQEFCSDPNYWAAGFHVRLENNIDLDPNLTGRIIYDKAPIAGDIDSTNFDSFEGNEYRGVFDANGYVISNMVIDGDDYCGLFGYLGSGSQIKNLGLENVSVEARIYAGGLTGYCNNGSILNCYSTGNLKDSYKAGGLIGESHKTIITNCYSSTNVDHGSGLIGYSVQNFVANCYTTGSITGGSGLIGNCEDSTVTDCYATADITGDGYIAGLITYNLGGTINNCYYCGDVNCTGNYVGGLVAKNFDNGIITNCYSLGTIDGYDYVGGLVGISYENSSINNCYSAVKVNGNDNVGGLVGVNDHGDMSNCYATGTVHAKSNRGGLIGDNWSGTITNCFWDKNTSGISTSDGGTGLTTTQMQIESTFTDAGWDFVGEIANGEEDIWQMPNGYRPRLAWEVPPVNPFLIADYNDFKKFCSDERYWLPDITARLEADLDLDPNLPGRKIYDEAPIASCMLIGTTYFSEGIEYSGHFDGNDHIISNLTIDGEDYCALFGKTTSSSVIENIGMQNSIIRNDGISYYTGSLVSYNSGDISNCYTENTNINGGGYASALVGCNTGKITNCYSENSIISGFFMTSALVGSNGNHYNYIGDARITNCYSTSSIINGGYNYTGGLVGLNYKSEITNCYSSCEVSGSIITGGLVGLNNEGSILNSWSEGSTITTFKSSYYIGGLVGSNYKGEVANCYANQTVSGGYDVGGLIGNNTGSVVKCHSTGTVTSLSSNNAYAGGLIGESKGDIESCYSTAAVSGVERYVGGLIGHQYGRINNCYATGDVNGLDDSVGGLVGYIAYHSGYTCIQNCYSTGNVTGSGNYVGGLVGENEYVDIVKCYSAGNVTGSGDYVASFVGYCRSDDSISNCFWDVNNSEIDVAYFQKSESYPAIYSTEGLAEGKTTIEMQMLNTFTDNGWDFVSENANGSDDIWRMCEDGIDYPKLWWEFGVGDFACDDGVNIVDFAVLAETWGLIAADADYNDRCDLVDDDVIDFDDLAILADNWLGGM